jgi:hypothetical protein
MKRTLFILAIAFVALASWRFVSEPRTEVDPVSRADVVAAPNDTAFETAGHVQDGEGSAEVQASKLSAGAPPRSNGTAGVRASAFESRMLTKNLVNDNAMKLLRARNFDEVVNALDAGNAGHYNPVTETYRNQVEHTLGNIGKQGQIDRFACGSNICMASIRTPPGETWFRDWYENLQPAATAPIGALAGYDVTLPGGMVEHRILFTTQPGSAGFVVPPMPPPQS